MKVLYCDFPDDLYFDVERDVYLGLLPNGRARVGITTVLSFLAGHIQKIKLDTGSQHVESGQKLATIESGKYFGAVRSPVSAQVAMFNFRVESEPRVVNNDPYGEGWIAELQGFDQGNLSGLLKGKAAAEKLEKRIQELKIRCFKKMPDEQLISVGVECSATLANLSEMLEKAPPGRVVHVVSDDPLAEMEMVRWS
ncbi:MAG: hypothetical protein ACREBQ_02140, partial [Nitrososphaerales archaeon]